MAGWQLERLPGEFEPATPRTMVDSGQDVSWGERDYKAEFRAMIDSEMERPPQMLIEARRELPSPGQMIVRAQVTNISTATLETAANSAMLHVKLYEGHKALKTGRIIHASDYGYFHDPLKPGHSRNFEFLFENLGGVSTSKLDAVVMVDYVPDPMTGRYDMLQAAIAKSGSLPPSPTVPPTSSPTPTVTATPTLVPTQPTPTPTITPSPEPEHHEAYLPALLRRYYLSERGRQ